MKPCNSARTSTAEPAMAATPTPSLLNKVTGSKTDAPPLDIRQMANDELPKINPAKAASFDGELGAPASFTLRFSVDGDAILDGSGLRDGDVKLSRLADGLSVQAIIKF